MYAIYLSNNYVYSKNFYMKILETYLFSNAFSNSNLFIYPETNDFLNKV